ncbi:MAG TPA: enoyl-CoA hydratase-related protein [Acidimicrobiales bacterium]|nr:enoyl-CoA hydratase-related protein [Acidimicrobiales bacterium]
MSSNLLVARPSDDVAVVSLNRPAKLNALTEGLVDEFVAILLALEDDPIRSVVLTGVGRGFCAGLDVSENAGVIAMDGPGSVRKAMRIARSFGRIVPVMRRFPKPIIAAVEGPAVGAGFVLACGADLRVVSRGAYFADGFVGLGLSGCELGLGYLLPRLVGASRAADLVMTGRRLPAEEAAAIGLANRLVDDGRSVDCALELAAELAANTPFGTWMTKETMWASFEGTSLDNVIALEARSQVLALLTEDAGEKRTAAAEQRRPRFTGA